LELAADAVDTLLNGTPRPVVDKPVNRVAEAVARLEDLGNLELKGLRRPVAAFNVTELI